MFSHNYWAGSRHNCVLNSFQKGKKKLVLILFFFVVEITRKYQKLSLPLSFGIFPELNFWLLI